MLLAAALSARRAAAGQNGLRVEWETEPPKFEQHLLICNAYPSDSSVAVHKNAHVGGQDLTAGGKGLKYQDCRYFDDQLKARDRLDFSMADLGVEGTFEVGDLPASNAVLLLVLEKRSGDSPLVSFQSFAFPMNAASKDAQLAVIDASGDGGKDFRLRMEDHVTGQEDKTVSRRIESLSFNRVYAIEAGAYDSSVVETSSGEAAGAEANSKRLLSLGLSKNYVLLWTGDGAKFPKSLVAFPPDLRSGAAARGFGAALALAAAAAAALLG